ncbi:hypothetical protein ACRTC9_03615 [Vibrio vulnificus]|uniref:hypothetical protein n=1 Tax=Vibrio vulnificus TaxID=672 RepID=UPI00102A4A40|nr:hypothetical protein [Vibrio vulnificus]EGQ8172976.1 hypothetical protein [Vibrio vulnificus]ELB7527711.1 hypothetical protein [Vibrio vulnificus]ELK2276036.1 hypothetical protein [Vibrio vulnificus]ELK2279671.1 hypothetical protein [Vibrio vulnificus]MCA3967197.1 hypothetical protein [Vibrio vulnificus]
MKAELSHQTIKLAPMLLVLSTLFSTSSALASDTDLDDLKSTSYQQVINDSKSIFSKYGIDENLPKLGLSSLTAGEHLVEQSTRYIRIGDKERSSRVFLVKDTDNKGNIDLRIKYNPSELDENDDAIAEIERGTRTQYRLRDYAQSYDPNSVRIADEQNGLVVVSFNYSKYGLPQDIAYFRFMQVAITVKDGQPLSMVINNSKPFTYDNYQIDSYRQTILFDRLASGRTILMSKDIEVIGHVNKKPLEIRANVVPVALYDDQDGVHVIHDELLSEVSDPRIREESVQLDSFFPLMGDIVRQKGIDLPLPYGFSVAYRNQEMNLPFNNFNIMGLGLNDLFDPSKSIGTVNADSLSLRGDINILPFWNVFGLLGKVNVDAAIDAEYTGKAGEAIKDKLNDKLPGLGNAFCRELVPALCNTANVHVPLHLEYDVIGVGSTLSVGYKEFFASVTGTYTTTRLKGNDDWGDPIVTIQPMLGYQLVDYRAQLFLGAEYQGLKPNMTGTIDSIEVGGKPFEYNVGLDMEEWAYLVGFNKQFGKNYNMTFLYNKGETRSSMTLNFGYRF